MDEEQREAPRAISVNECDAALTHSRGEALDTSGMNEVPSRQASLFSLPLLAVLLMAGCSSVPLEGRHTASMGATLAAGPPDGEAASERLTLAERTFMSQAVSRAMYEVEVSRLAADRAMDPRVRSYARALAGHSAHAGSELGTMMKAKGVPRPAGLAADKATKLHRLAALRPSPNFDLGYARVVGVEDHQATIALYERARRYTKDRDLKAWIDKTLPVLRNQLAAAQTLLGHLAG
jgi:putative membrane protein